MFYHRNDEAHQDNLEFICPLGLARAGGCLCPASRFQRLAAAADRFPVALPSSHLRWPRSQSSQDESAMRCDIQSNASHSVLYPRSSCSPTRKLWTTAPPARMIRPFCCCSQPLHFTQRFRKCVRTALERVQAQLLPELVSGDALLVGSEDDDGAEGRAAGHREELLVQQLALPRAAALHPGHPPQKTADLRRR